ncbi:MAG TPA: hypothetical protein PLE01_05210 [Syntrophothermus lipocalidus]|nr:hypothetical protein [Syntrophothermus lipocalidus]
MKRIIAVAALVCLLVLSLCLTNPAWGKQEEPKVVLILIDRLSFQDIERTSCPNITGLWNRGSAGLMNTRTLGVKDTDDACVTIGAGRMARSGPNELLGFDADEGYRFHQRRAGDLYQGLTGYNPGKHEVLLLNLPEIIAVNQEDSAKTVPGALGESLKQAGLKTCVLGNGDLPGVYRRNGVAVAMDALGLVDFGEVGEKCHVLSGRAPGTWETDYTFLWDRFRYYWDKSDFIVVELSDLTRLEAGEAALPDAFLRERQRLLHEIDSFVGEVSRQVNPLRDLLILVSPSPSQLDKDSKVTLTPLIVYGPGFEKGIIYSATTRRDYLAANLDIAPTILKFLGVKSSYLMEGREIETHAFIGENKLGEVAALFKETAFVNQLRAPLVKGYVGAEIVVLLLMLFVLFFTKQDKYARWVEFLVFALACVPLVLLVAPFIPVRNPVGFVGLTVVLLLAAVGTIFRAAGSSVLNRFLTIALLTVLLLDIDVITGCQLIKSSVLGYDPSSGARYYGIGNEYMGVLIGTTIIAATIAYQKWRNRFWLVGTGAFFALQVFILAAPNLGANAGGTIAALAAFALTVILMSGLRLRARTVLGIGLLVVSLVVLMAALDMQRPPELQSHIGRAANMIISGGWTEAYGIITRKLAMNIKLIRYTIWSRVFLVSLATLAVLLYRPHGVIKSIGEEYPYVLRGLVGVVTGAFVALVFNDSGIVAAATTTIFAASPLSCLTLTYMKGGARK